MAISRDPLAERDGYIEDGSGTTPTLTHPECEVYIGRGSKAGLLSRTTNA